MMTQPTSNYTNKCTPYADTQQCKMRPVLDGEEWCDTHGSYRWRRREWREYENKAQAEAARVALDEDERITCSECGTNVSQDEYWQCPTCLKSMCLQCHEARAWNGECDGCMLGERVALDEATQ